jgi:hypothetical protein
MNEPRTEPGWLEVCRNTIRALLRRRQPAWWLRRGLVVLVGCAVAASTWLVWDRSARSNAGTSAAPVVARTTAASATAATTARPRPTVTSARPTAKPRPLTRQEARYLRRAEAIEPLLLAGGREQALRLAKDLCVQFYDGVPRSVRASRVERRYPVTHAEAIEVVEAACASFCPE